MTQLDFFVAGRWRNYHNVKKVLDAIRSEDLSAYCFIENKYEGHKIEFDPNGNIDEIMKAFEAVPQTDEFVKKIFDNDMKAERNAKNFVLVLPAGISGNVEAGVAYGLGKKCYAVGITEKTETLYNVFEKIFPTPEAFSKWLRDQKNYSS